MIEANKKCCFWSVFSKKRIAEAKTEIDVSFKPFQDECIEFEKEAVKIKAEIPKDIEKIKNNQIPEKFKSVSQAAENLKNDQQPIKDIQQSKWPSAIEADLPTIMEEGQDDDMHSCYTESSQEQADDIQSSNKNMQSSPTNDKKISQSINKQQHSNNKKSSPSTMVSKQSIIITL